MDQKNTPPTIWVDADACPKAIKTILLRASERVGVTLIFVANQALFLPRSERIRSVVVDQGFDNVKIDEDEFYMPFFDVCMEAENTSATSTLKLRGCNKNEKQKFKFNNNAEIVLNDNTNLCLTVSENSREGGGGTPTHLIRDLTLDNCRTDISSRQKWGLRKAQ